MRRNYPHRHTVVCTNCGYRDTYEHDRRWCDYPRVIELSECRRCTATVPQTILDRCIRLTLKKCPTCGQNVYDDETGNWHTLRCRGPRRQVVQT
jgi:DNA-directed RNA polymerase subunit RPC12/RpoP